ncbi:Transmembrane and coiled-coil domain-containing protein 4 [Fragariocoptes setiger]|uniref:Transmembrane and coiled-coil domain-containing protein 4 n=1 Tax=Fragariocoptes setiger TaxID=1670756 RepID=A0ABQ7S645_9ACAR|nr:Transmembrane and coiled-coil domain-containing protein 4 [Fragariocoptes setiger]
MVVQDRKVQDDLGIKRSTRANLCKPDNIFRQSGPEQSNDSKQEPGLGSYCDINHTIKFNIHQTEPIRKRQSKKRQLDQTNQGNFNTQTEVAPSNTKVGPSNQQSDLITPRKRNFNQQTSPICPEQNNWASLIWQKQRIERMRFSINKALKDIRNRISSSSTQLSTPIPDVVAYSLCALAAIELRKNYAHQMHSQFIEETIKSMAEHLKLPSKVLSSINEFSTIELAETHGKTFLDAIGQNKEVGAFRIIEELVLFSVKFGSYDARSHFLVMRIASHLGVSQELVEIYGESVFESLSKNQISSASQEECTEDAEARAKRATRKKYKKYLLIGLASIGGGTVIGVTGGLAAPIVASAVAGVIGAGSLAMSTVAVGIVGSLFGVAGAGLTGAKMNKRIGDLEEFEFEKLSPSGDGKSLTFTIAISGWVSDDSEEAFTRQWANLNNSKEQYCIRYETKYLLELSKAMDYLLSFVVSYATQEALKQTFLAGLMYAIAWPTALITMANVIDNPWDVCLGRAAEAGKHLADILISRPEGERPVSLIGFSLGARVIYYCLQELSQRKGSEGIIGDVYMLGAPVTASTEQWRSLINVVCGHITNGYCSSDWLLKFLYRTSSAAITVAGLQEIKLEFPRLRNIDLKPIVSLSPSRVFLLVFYRLIFRYNSPSYLQISGHMDYYKNLDQVLGHVGIKIFKKVSEDLISANDSGLPRTTSDISDMSTKSL